MEYVQTPDRLLETLQGDCDDKVTLLCSLLTALGYRTAFIASGFDPDDLKHVYCAVEIGDDWFALDPVADGQPPGWRQQLPVEYWLEVFPDDGNEGLKRMVNGLADFTDDFFTPSGGGIDWNAILNRGIDVAGAALSKSPYFSPDDPRFNPDLYGNRGQAGTPYGYPTGQIGVQASANYSPQSAGFNLNFTPTTWLLIIGAVLLLTRKK